MPFCILRNIRLSQHQNDILLYLLEDLVLAFMFRSVTHHKLTCVCGLREGLRIISPQCVYPVVPTSEDFLPIE